MTRYLLDTNILSILTKPVPSATLIAWMAEQSDEGLFISALTLAELRRGVLEKPDGKDAINWRHGFWGRRVPQPCLPIEF